jgi:hypothetical protein
LAPGTDKKSFITLAPEQLQLRGREAEKVLQRSPLREREGQVRVPDQAGRLPRPGAVPQEEDFVLSRRFFPHPCRVSCLRK